jgi:hypothetical protein
MSRRRMELTQERRMRAHDHASKPFRPPCCRQHMLTKANIIRRELGLRRISMDQLFTVGGYRE